MNEETLERKAVGMKNRKTATRGGEDCLGSERLNE